MSMWAGFIWLMIRLIRLVMGSCEHDNQASDPIKDRTFD
jgi:hypothetical protein